MAFMVCSLDGSLTVFVTNDYISGPIVIHGPSSANWDEDLGPWVLSDWYHADVFGLEWVGETTFLAALPDSFVLNGKGKFQDQGELYEVVVRKNKTYKIGIINTSTLLTYTFWIDGHNLTIIQTDFVPIEPYTVSVLNIGIGMFHTLRSLSNIF